MNQELRAPWPWPGGKKKAAHYVWGALGNPRLYVEPFFGSGAVLLSRPEEPVIETVSDADGLLCNVWRSLKLSPEVMAKHADFPVSELDLTARHQELVLTARRENFRKQLENDPEWHDPKLAGWWVWGASQWIGKGWCSDRPKASRKKRPEVSPEGLHTIVPRQMPQAHGIGGTGVHGHRVPEKGGIYAWFDALSVRLRQVRILCGDFERCLTKSTLYVEGQNIVGIFLDPPYTHDKRDPEIYAHDDPEASKRAREWALEHGDDPRYRIVLAGLEGEHEMPKTWRVVPWEGTFGLGRSKGNNNRKLERLWMSPHCLGRDGPLFEQHLPRG